MMVTIDTAIRLLQLKIDDSVSHITLVYTFIYNTQYIQGFSLRNFLMNIHIHSKLLNICDANNFT